MARNDKMLCAAFCFCSARLSYSDPSCGMVVNIHAVSQPTWAPSCRTNSCACLKFHNSKDLSCSQFCLL